MACAWEGARRSWDGQGMGALRATGQLFPSHWLRTDEKHYDQRVINVSEASRCILAINHRIDALIQRSTW